MIKMFLFLLRKQRSELLDTINRKQAEIERLQEYENIRPTGCPNCHRGNFSNSKFCSHCGTQLQGKKKDARAEAIKDVIEKIINQTKNNNAISVEWLHDYLKKLENEMVGDDT